MESYDAEKCIHKIKKIETFLSPMENINSIRLQGTMDNYNHLTSPNVRVGSWRSNSRCKEGRSSTSTIISLKEKLNFETAIFIEIFETTECLMNSNGD